MLENWCATYNMATINDGKETHISRNAEGKGTAPDQTFIYASKMDRFTWEVVDELPSDHNPIIITVISSLPSTTNRPTSGT